MLRAAVDEVKGRGPGSPQAEPHHEVPWLGAPPVRPGGADVCNWPVRVQACGPESPCHDCSTLLHSEEVAVNIGPRMGGAVFQ